MNDGTGWVIVQPYSTTATFGHGRRRPVEPTNLLSGFARPLELRLTCMARQYPTRSTQW